MKETRRYWDSSCFLAWLKNEPGRVDDCRGVLQAAEKGQLQIITSTLTLAEVLYLRFRDRIPKAEAEKVKAYFQNDYFITISLDRSISEKAQEIIWDYEVKPKDAIHVASALFAGIEILETFDEGFKKFHQKIGNPPLQIRKPYLEYQLELNEKKDE